MRGWVMPHIFVDRYQCFDETDSILKVNEYSASIFKVKLTHLEDVYSEGCLYHQATQHHPRWL
jgi:hypothetical protein